MVRKRLYVQIEKFVRDGVPKLQKAPALIGRSRSLETFGASGARVEKLWCVNSTLHIIECVFLINPRGCY
jgi:hypothetical protein